MLMNLPEVHPVFNGLTTGYIQHLNWQQANFISDELTTGFFYV